MLPALAGLTLTACSAAGPPPPQHTGWSIRYTERAGTSDRPLEVGPALTLHVLDGEARGAAVARNRSARWRAADPASAERCAEGRCAPSPRVDALCALAGLDALAAPPNLTEQSPTVQRTDDDEIIAGVRTRGARFVTALVGPGTRLALEVETRFIADPSDPSAAAGREFFLAPLRRLGADGMVAHITATVGLPLRWEARVTRYPADGTEPVVGVTVYRAAELANPQTLR